MEAADVSDKTLDKYRLINVEHEDWWDGVYEMFKEDMKEQGIEVDRIYFSGFYSQGDGACFEGRLYNERLFLSKNCKPEEYPMIHKLLDNGGAVVLSVEHSGRYYHEECTRYDSNADRLIGCIKTPTYFHEQVVEQWEIELDIELAAFETQSIEIFKNHMRTLYGTLRVEYVYLTSDEAVADTIIANELDGEE